MYILPNGLKGKRFVSNSKPITETGDLLVNPFYFLMKTTWKQPNDYSLIATTLNRYIPIQIVPYLANRVTIYALLKSLIKYALFCVKLSICQNQNHW